MFGGKVNWARGATAPPVRAHLLAFLFFHFLFFSFFFNIFSYT
jgi:hypothetical protein